MPNNWKGHLGISVSELYVKNALGLLINNRSNFWEERIIVRKIAATFREEWIIARKFGVNHWAKRIIIRKVVPVKTIGVTKMRGNFMEISFQAKFLRKATKSREFRRDSFALLLHNTVHVHTECKYGGPLGCRQGQATWSYMKARLVSLWCFALKLLPQKTLVLSSFCSVLFRYSYESLCFWIRRKEIEIFHRSPLKENSGLMQFVEMKKRSSRSPQELKIVCYISG